MTKVDINSPASDFTLQDYHGILATDEIVALIDEINRDSEVAHLEAGNG